MARAPPCRLRAHSPRAGARALILAPARELALQLHKVVRELGRYTDLRTAVLVGGDSMEAQFAELAANPDILLATPGALRCVRAAAAHGMHVPRRSSPAVHACMCPDLASVCGRLRGRERERGS